MNKKTEELNIIEEITIKHLEKKKENMPFTVANLVKELRDYSELAAFSQDLLISNVEKICKILEAVGLLIKLKSKDENFYIKNIAIFSLPKQQKKFTRRAKK